MKSIYEWLHKQNKKICFHKWLHIRTGFDRTSYESDYLCEKCEKWKTIEGKF